MTTVNVLHCVVNTEVGIYTQLKATVETITGTYPNTIVGICITYVIIRKYRSYVCTAAQCPVITQVEVAHHRNLQENRTPSKIFRYLCSLAYQEYIRLNANEFIDSKLIAGTNFPVEVSIAVPVTC